MHKFDIGIVIVSYNVRHFLEQCLRSVQNAVSENLSVEVWVVDNDSVDGTEKMMNELFPDIHFIANDKNVGFSTANNQAIREMDAKYILLLNPDTIVVENTLQLCYEFMEQRPKAGVVGVRMIDGAGKFLPESKRNVPNLWNSFCKLSYLSDLFPRSKLFSGYNLGYLPEMETNKVEVLCGAFMFIRNQVLEEIGLLDEAFFMYGEDIDLSYRILKAGYDVWYYPETTIIHYKGESTKKGSLNYLRLFYGAMHIYVSKHYGQGDARVFARIINMAITVRAVLSAIVNVLTALIRPLLDMILLFISLYGIKLFWAGYYFQDKDYYDDSPILWILATYVLIWVFVLWINGYYENVKDWYKRLTSLVAGTVIILLIYALLPEWLRSSRAIILLGSVAGMIVLSLTSLMWKLRQYGKKSVFDDYNIAIVASKSNAVKLQNILEASRKCGTFYYIAPDKEIYDVHYTNIMDNLPKVVKELKVDEVVYNSEDVQMQDIIQSMSTIGTNVALKIGSSRTQSIIGSDDRNAQGELFSLEVKYRLDDISTLRYKRLVDIILAFIFIPLSPILFVINSFRMNIFVNIFKVLVGMSTWVGYGGSLQDYDFLPQLPKAVIPYPESGRSPSDVPRSANIEYARHYMVLRDVLIVFKNIFRLGRFSS